MDKIILKQKFSAYRIAGDILESGAIVLVLWLAWSNPYATTLAFCAAFALLIYRIRNDSRTTILTRTQLCRKRLYGKAQGAVLDKP